VDGTCRRLLTGEDFGGEEVGTPLGLPCASYLYSITYFVFASQNSHSKWLIGKFVFLKELGDLKRKPGKKAGFSFDLYINRTGFDITPMQLGSCLFSVGYVVLELDMRFC
jgi:hypothetical protein